jgi:hypothetical protein
VELAAADQPWAPLSVSQTIDLLTDVHGLWWLSGGWALEENAGHLDSPSRAHGDIDVTVPREQWPTVHASLRQRMQVWIAKDGHLHDTAITPVTDEVHNLWARPLAGGPWQLQLNLEDIRDEMWIYRRHHRVQRPIAEASWWSGRCRCIAPAVQLLWKAAAPRGVDEHDYAMVMSSLSRTERLWLGRAIRTAHPDSPWAGRPELDEK